MTYFHTFIIVPFYEKKKDLLAQLAMNKQQNP